MTKEGQSQAAIDLGLTPPSAEDTTLAAFHLRAITLLAQLQAAHGSEEAANLFDRLAALARATAKNPKSKRPAKPKGSHDAGADAILIALWRHSPHASKHEFARQLIARKLVRRVAPTSLIRHLDRLLAAQDQDK